MRALSPQASLAFCSNGAWKVFDCQFGRVGARLKRCRLAHRERSLLHFGLDLDDLVTQLPRPSVELLLLPLPHLRRVGFLLLLDVRFLPEQVIDNPGQLVSRRGNRLGGSQTRTLTTKVRSQVAITPQQTPRRQTKGMCRSTFATARLARLHLAARLLEVRAQSQPRP